MKQTKSQIALIEQLKGIILALQTENAELVAASDDLLDILGEQLTYDAWENTEIIRGVEDLRAAITKAQGGQP